jgi:hypothetical protein
MSDVVSRAAEPVITRPPGPLDRLLLPASVVQATLDGLSLARDREMAAFWLGAALPPDAEGRARGIVTTVAFPRVESAYAAFRVADGQMGRITEWCAAHGLWVIAQVHTHPTDEPHSEADECWPASHRAGFLSIVVPFFAQFATLRDPQFRVHELVRGDVWRHVDPNDRLFILGDVWVPYVG